MKIKPNSLLIIYRIKNKTIEHILYIQDIKKQISTPTISTTILIGIQLNFMRNFIAEPFDDLIQNIIQESYIKKFGYGIKVIQL